MVTVARSKADTYSDKDSHLDIVINVINLLPYKYKQRFQNELLEGVGPNILSVLRDKNSLVYNRLEGAWNFLVPTQSHVLSNDSSPQTTPLDDTATTGHVISLLKIGSTVYQERYNEEHGITPRTIIKPIRDVIEATKAYTGDTELKNPKEMTTKELQRTIKNLEKEMKQAAKDLQFERAAELRDLLFDLRSSKRA